MAKKATVKRTSLSYMIAAARKVWRWTDERKAVIKRCIVFEKFRCEKCRELVGWGESKKMPIQVDHIDPVGTQPKTWTEFGVWIDRLFCPLSNLQGICLKCHKAKTKAEGVIRYAKRKTK